MAAHACTITRGQRAPSAAEPFRVAGLSRSVRSIDNGHFGIEGVRFSILIIVNSTATDVYVGSRDPGGTPGSSTCELVYTMYVH
jgi:hypothetical protein